MKVFKDYKKTKSIIDQIILHYPASVTRFKKQLSNELKNSGNSLMSGGKKLPLLSSGYLIFGAVNFSSFGTINAHCNLCKTGNPNHKRQFNYYRPSNKTVTQKVIPCVECLNERLFDFSQTYGQKWYFPVFKYLLKKYLTKKIEAK